MSSQAVLSHTELRKPVADLFEPRPLIYWGDFMLSSLIGWGAFLLALLSPLWSFTWATASMLSACGFYRAAVFTHELVHLRDEYLPGFRGLWNICCGIPLLIPSFMYDGVHQEHHFRRQYGTREDGEYLSFGRPPRRRIIWYLLSHLLLPPLAVLRFALLAPLSLLSPRWRRELFVRASSLSIDPRYRRTVPPRIPLAWTLQEFACSIYLWLLLGLALLGLLPLKVFGQFYVVNLAVLLMNAVRTLAAHRYRNDAGPLSFEQQLGDSINLTGGGLLTPLLAPVGLRYHALHHLFPTMPYHNLGTAHRRLMSQLPVQALYRHTARNTVWVALAELWNNAAGRSGRGSAPSDLPAR